MPSVAILTLDRGETGGRSVDKEIASRGCPDTVLGQDYVVLVIAMALVGI
ncbi:hypothetical protein GCM10011588_72900 [Nocardia jinanensis]|uniref:Uncharacterized protein n=1 Tax=Nocardia jinanensis TaxID=382504 RepID=A0A917RZR4_9NOCA|nr:hypothetical protein GCM10011588_72900 [Nocardia jinanensis]